PISKEQTMGDLLQAGNASEQRAYVEPQPSPVVLAAERELHTPEQMEREIDSLRKRMQKAAKELNFVDAALLRDEMLRLQAELEQKNVQR
ncbi:MAG: UvrB/UvrC motif-containing protein, partial [Paraprevotella sp.]|nr:UvrB/UvrC motif-containing protein [Paraprevotella sp.]MDY5265891.1 UvrB/UvrC motif-containing protein [Bacteroidaceae bacterium]